MLPPMADTESQLLHELRALAGVKVGDSFELVHDGVRIRVSYSGGSSSSLTLAVTYDAVAIETRTGAGYRARSTISAIRPMLIALRPEEATHRLAKASGTDVEFQSGDPGFDGAVYVDTQTPADVLAAVLEADARRAVLDLFALAFTTITIDDRQRNVVAIITSFASLKPMDPTGARAVDAFARLARSLPRVATRAGEHARHPLRGVNIGLGVLAGVAFVGSIPLYCGGVMGKTCGGEMDPAEAFVCLGPGLAGGTVGLVAGAVAGAAAAAFARRYRGRSDSSSYGSTFAGFVFFLTLVTTTLLVAWVVER